MFQNIADAEISAGDAALFINSQLKGFNSEFSKFSSTGEASMHVIDSVNEVANNFAVGTNHRYHYRWYGNYGWSTIKGKFNCPYDAEMRVGILSNCWKLLRASYTTT